MRKVLFILPLLLLLCGTAFAKDHEYRACTADKHPATLKIALADDVSVKAEENVHKAFTETANALSGEVLVTIDGFRVFVSKLSDEAAESITGLYGPPVVTDAACKEVKASSLGT